MIGIRATRLPICSGFNFMKSSVGMPRIQWGPILESGEQVFINFITIRRQTDPYYDLDVYKRQGVERAHHGHGSIAGLSHDLLG